MADSKVSALTELAVAPANSDEFYINDGGVSKRITYATLKTGMSDSPTLVTPTLNLPRRSVAAGVTAAVGSSQGDGAITTDIVQISTCANAGDAVTLPAAAAGLEITIANNGAEACDVFPASGDNLGAGANTAASLAAGANITYIAYDATNWFAKT